MKIELTKCLWKLRLTLFLAKWQLGSYLLQERVQWRPAKVFKWIKQRVQRPKLPSWTNRNSMKRIFLIQNWLELATSTLTKIRTTWRAGSRTSLSDLLKLCNPKYCQALHSLRRKGNCPSLVLLTRRIGVWCRRFSLLHRRLNTKTWASLWRNWAFTLNSLRQWSIQRQWARLVLTSRSHLNLGLRLSSPPTMRKCPRPQELKPWSLWICSTPFHPKAKHQTNLARRSLGRTQLRSLSKWVTILRNPDKVWKQWKAFNLK